MIHTYYTITGMTCQNCRSSIENTIKSIPGVHKVVVNHEKKEAKVSSEHPVPIEVFKKVLPKKYDIFKKEQAVFEKRQEKTKLRQLKPLFIIFLYILMASLLLNYKEWNISDFMLDFMGIFYIVFSFFKLLDIKGFSETFAMYDPLAKAIPLYGWIYPFIETALALMLLMRFEIKIALITTIAILGVTTIGVTKILLNKKRIQCACLGTALKLPMTLATFIENSIMIVMAVIMLLKLYS